MAPPDLGSRPARHLCWYSGYGTLPLPRAWRYLFARVHFRGGSRSGAGGGPSRAFLAEQHLVPASPLERSQDRAGSGEEILAGAAGNPETAPGASGGGCAVRTCLRYRRKCLGPGNPRCPDAPELGFRAWPASGCGFPASQGTPGPSWWSGRIVSWAPGPLFPLPRAPPSQPPGSGPLVACAVLSTHHALCLQPGEPAAPPPAQLSPSRARRLRVPASFTVLSAPAAPPFFPLPAHTLCPGERGLL